MTIAELEDQVASTQAQIAPLASRLEQLNRQLREAKSRQFISANNITKEDVEMSSGDGKPWFGIVTDFEDWLRDNSSKRWAEWNGRIYNASDLIRHKMPDSPGETRHLS